MNDFTDITYDAEATGLLNETSIDYTQSPFKLRDDFKLHCIVVEEHQTGDIIAFYDGPTIPLDGRKHEVTVEGNTYTLEKYEPITYKHKQLSEFKGYISDTKIRKVIAHNQINYDLLLLKLTLEAEYEILEKDMWCGREVEFVDTLIMSKTLNADRYPNHALDSLAKHVGMRKVEFRTHLPKEERFKHFAPDMLYYNIFDSKVNTRVYLDYLLPEKGDWNWDGALWLEKFIANIVTMQEHRGFKLFEDKCTEAVKELDGFMKEIEDKILPILPEKPLTKTDSKNYVLNAAQFTKKGEVSKALLKFLDKHGGKINKTKTKVLLFNKVWDLPLPKGEPLVKTCKMEMKDTTHIKEWLVGEGWIPMEFKDRDLSIRMHKGNKVKRTEEEYRVAVKKYVEETRASNFCKYRCEHLKTNSEGLQSVLLRKDFSKSVKVLTNPSFTTGQSKEMCPNLEKLKNKFPYAEDIVKYLTYKHRRNSILGGGMDPDWQDDDSIDQEPEKGYLANQRKDRRIPTPADTCGAATGRMKHRIVVNVPRPSSLYGEKLRELFGVDEGFYQVGYDFSSLEARMEAHYCFPYDNKNKDYCNSLLMEKPNDVHCFDKNTEILTKQGWKFFKDLNSKDEVAQWETNNNVDFVKPNKIFCYEYSGELYKTDKQNLNMAVTPNHRIISSDYKKKNDWEVSIISNFNYSQRVIPTSGVTTSVKEFNIEFLKLIVATQADGYLNKDSSAISFSFTKERKIERLKNILDSLSAKYTIGEHFRKNRKEVSFRVCASPLTVAIREYVTEDKEINYNLLELNSSCLLTMIKELQFWDGTKTKNGNIVLDTTSEEVVDFFQAACSISGLKSTKTFFNKKTTYSPNSINIIRLYISWETKTNTCLEKDYLYKEKYNDKVYCVEVPSGKIIVRRSGTVYVSGNSITARKIADMLLREFIRDHAKAVKYGCTYGATAQKVMKIVGCDLRTATLIYDAFWKAAYPLAELKEQLGKYWEQVGKRKFILGLDGRKIPTRAKHALLNSLFQSAGVICAKRAAVIHYMILKEMGLIIDFFRDDWKANKFCQQLIMMHDETQLEVSKDLVKFKKFSTEEKAEEWKKQYEENTGKILSGVIHKGDDYFVAYSIIGETAVKAAIEAGEYYNLNVPLAAEYMVGTNWAETH